MIVSSIHYHRAHRILLSARVLPVQVSTIVSGFDPSEAPLSMRSISLLAIFADPDPLIAFVHLTRSISSGVAGSLSASTISDRHELSLTWCRYRLKTGRLSASHQTQINLSWCIWAANTVLALVRHMQLLHRAALGAFTAPVIASGGVCLSVPHQLLHGGEIRAGVKEVAGKGPP